jgi:hypothetical protein
MDFGFMRQRLAGGPLEITSTKAITPIFTFFAKTIRLLALTC